MARRRWVAPVVYGVLGLELAVVIIFSATYNALDFRIYMWGGQAVLHDSRLYLVQAFGHWFTYSPFAAITFVPVTGLPLAVARAGWDLASVAALAWSCVIILRLAGGRPSRLMTGGLVAAALVLAAGGLAVACALARRQDWLGATAVTGLTGLLVSPVSWAHHWVWVLAALVLLVRSGHRAAAVAGYLLFAVAPFWFTPHSGGPREYGFHGLVTLAADSFLIAGLVFLGFMALAELRRLRHRPGEDLGVRGLGQGAGTDRAGAGAR